MIVIFLAVFFAVPAWWLVGRAKRKKTLAGLNANKPVFSLEPPSRRVSPLKGERL